jgi:hypothetical protein
MEGTSLCALTAGGAQLLINHINTGLGILSDRTVLTSLHAFATLDTCHRLCAALPLNYANTRQIGIKGLMESIGTCANALKARHTLNILFNSKFFHLGYLPNIIHNIIANVERKCNANLSFFRHFFLRSNIFYDPPGISKIFGNNDTAFYFQEVLHEKDFYRYCVCFIGAYRGRLRQKAGY